MELDVVKIAQELISYPSASLTSNVEVTLDSGSISAEQVVDTRVPDSFDMNKATLKQIF